MSSTPAPQTTSTTSPAVRAGALVLTAAVAAGAFAVSFHALTEFASSNAVPAHLAWIWAVVVDATILAGTLAHVACPPRAGPSSSSSAAPPYRSPPTRPMPGPRARPR